MRAYFYAFAALVLSAPASAEWHRANSEHFIIYANEPADELRTFVDRLERFDRTVRSVRKMSDPPLTDAGRVTIFMVPTEASIQRLCDCGNVAGFYRTRASGSVAFVPKKAGLTRDIFEVDADAIFFHEYAHHLQLQGADVALPPWAREGFAEFFARTQLREDGSAVIGVPPAYRGYGLFENSSTSIRALVASDGYGEGIYSWGWALTHFLTFNPQRRGQFDRYVDSISKGVTPLKAGEAAFGDLGVLTSEVEAYVRRRTLPHLILRGADITPGSVTVRKVGEGTAEILPTYIRLEAKRTGSARDVAADARKIAARYPSDAFVQAVLARAEFEAKNYVAADGASTRAISLDPNNFSALVTKGKARMEIARGSQGGDWREIRRWFLKANKVDPEAAEPLQLFYKSFVYAHEQPTPNAVDGLLYAMSLAPQDSLLRLAAVRHLLARRELAKAKVAIAPFAYSPHWKNAWRALAGKAVASIDQGRADEAIGHVEKLQQLIEDAD